MDDNDDIRITPEAQGLATKIEALIDPSLEAMGYGVVRVQLTGGKRPTLQIMAERIDNAPMSVDDCADISRASSAILDVEDIITGAYHLEVSSPGIDRPLTKRGDFARFAGFEVKIDADRLIDGRKRFKGRLLGVDDQDIVRLRDAGIDYSIPLGSVVRAKLVLTDDLLKNSPDRPVL
ncbi:ribosome maturation factor RimP [Lacibacterium aquatile]|uniref:Ribosome maturation factor RimP n=1 Tax=Lacibacterium aquatile TaxID=1168082 RepID=A0ABW5E097_9PROT